MMAKFSRKLTAHTNAAASKRMMFAITGVKAREIIDSRGNKQLCCPPSLRRRCPSRVCLKQLLRRRRRRWQLAFHNLNTSIGHSPAYPKSPGFPPPLASSSSENTHNKEAIARIKSKFVETVFDG
jgi:hypothetical protein